MHTRVLISSVLGIASAATLFAQSDTVRAGREIAIRTSESIDARSPSDSRIYRGVVERDVRSEDGRVMIPSGSNAELILRNSTRDEVVLDLESVDVHGQRYAVSTENESVQAGGSEKQGVGANRRTGKYVGGGAVIGSIIGAIAGGGKGAAIGAAAGAGAGAGRNLALVRFARYTLKRIPSGCASFRIYPNRMANRMSATISESQDWVREKRAMSGPDSPRGTERFFPGFRNIGKHRSVRR